MPTEEKDPATPTTPLPLTDAVGERLYRARAIVVSGEINQALAARVTSQLLALSAESSDPITMYLNSQGGHVEAGDTIHDMVRFVDAPVRMVGTGWVASAGALIYVSVPRERRFCLPNTRFLIHQPSGGAGGPASDIAIHAQEIIKARERVARIIARETGRSIESVQQDIERDRWMSAEEAIEYGLVGRIVERKRDLKG